jgi:5'-3' exoribonuclease 2
MVLKSHQHLTLEKRSYLLILFQTGEFPQQRPINGVPPPLPPSNWIGKQPSGGPTGVPAKHDPRTNLDKQLKQDNLRSQQDKR